MIWKSLDKKLIVQHLSVPSLVPHLPRICPYAPMNVRYYSESIYELFLWSFMIYNNYYTTNAMWKVWAAVHTIIMNTELCAFVSKPSLPINNNLSMNWWWEFFCCTITYPVIWMTGVGRLGDPSILECFSINLWIPSYKDFNSLLEELVLINFKLMFNEVFRFCVKSFQVHSAISQITRRNL